MASSRPSSDRVSAGLVVICCAAADAKLLSEPAEALREDGHQVEVATGLDQDPKALHEIIEAHGGEGLYVLCRSPRLGRALVEQLREVLLAGHVPFGRTLTVALGGRGKLVDRIRSGLQRASSRKGNHATVSRAAVGSPRPRPRAPLVDDDEPILVGVGLRELAAEAQEIDPEEHTRTAERLRPAGAGPLPDLPPSPPAPTSDPSAETRAEPRPEPEPSTDEQTSIVEEMDPSLLREDTSLSNPRISLSEVDFSDLDAGDTASHPVFPRPGDTTAPMMQPALITGDTVIGPAPAMITGSTMPGLRLPSRVRRLAERAAARRVTAEAELEPPTTPFPRMGDDGLPLPSQLPIPRSRTAPATPPAASSSGATTTAPTPITGPLVPSPAAPLPPRSSTAGTDPKLLWGLVGGGVLLLGLVVAIAAWPDDEPSDASTVATKEDASAEGDASTPTEEDGGNAADGAETEPPAPPAPRYPVLEALRARKVRALDVLLVAGELGPAADHSTASAYCSTLEIEGLTDWRLPQVGELGSLSEANMIDRGYYWSSTPADSFGDTYLAWNERRSYAERHGSAAIAICVRGTGTGS